MSPTDQIRQNTLLGLPWLFLVSTVQLWLFHIWLHSPSSVWQLCKCYSGKLEISFSWFWSRRHPGVSTSPQKATPLPFSWKQHHSWLGFFERGWIVFFSPVIDTRLAKIKRRTLESSEDLQVTPSFTHLGTPNNDSLNFDQVQPVQSSHCWSK